MDPFDQRLAQLDVDIEAVHQRAAAATAFRQGTEKVRGRSSVDGIEVTVDSAGTLIDLDLGQDLAWARKAILEAYQKARQEAGRAVVTLAQENLGEDDPSISRLQEVYGITDEPERPEDSGAPRVGVWRPGGALLPTPRCVPPRADGTSSRLRCSAPTTPAGPRNYPRHVRSPGRDPHPASWA